MRLLLLEDDQVLGSGLAAFLRGEGHLVDWCQRIGEVLLLGKEPYDAMIVDWHLPDGSGLNWVRQLRADKVHTPVIVMTARDLLADRVQGLDAGADDYMVKPVEPQELSARLRAVCRRATGAAGPQLHFGEVGVDLTRRLAFLDGAEVELTSKEWRIVESLVLRSGRYVSRSELEALAHGADSETSSNTLEVHISSVRRKLGKDFIETLRGVGYRVRK